MQIKPAHAFFAPALLAVALALGACGKQDNKDQQQQQQKPAEVGVVTMEPRTVTLTDELPGRTAAFRIAEVRPQVSGILLKRYFTEGADVKAGTQLYQIDPRTYEANVNSAKASLAQAQATLASNRLKAQRYGALVKEQAISKQEADDALSMQRQNEAQVESARAALRNAEINLAYTKVAAPISGRIGRSMMTEGALVTADQTTALTSITQLDPIYVDVTQSATDLLRLRRELDSGQLQRVQGENAAEVKLMLEDGSAYSRSGKLKFAEVSVDQGTGSVTIRAEFPNPDKLLLPGMFVRAQLQSGVRQNALLVPQQGVTRDLKGQPTAMVVNGEGKVEQRILKTERTVGSDWLVTDGLKAGDKVITEGLQKIKPGATVTTKPASNIASAEQKPAGQGQ
ncbi:MULTISPECIES: efflux RND transporter periplasmic adaptor subunit [Pseudomonas]|uniref:Efflux RND transporter periplasmic adaptor subunit n=1 Tax=Pseudomonas benzopyrenica TaxID=2993566 RepID=A0ABZ2FST9_9PSED|nr:MULTISPECIES: efflux RND transporter periplasmic adaptor subunit [Pseudomonas]MCD4866330.1 efflux RND transporter periplasmic adaptor subunit [Pseudomonas sp. PLB05]MXS21036.1 efflux RND transporter periplasmic adaptor subunit [Pseudomonas oryzihabitans]UUW70183.1 efflux RND transporter periplasmic adaptor subunit [Pseudomonas psychrotolerans]